MLLLSGIVDYFLVGRFASSTINNLMINTGLGARYATVPFVYLLVLLGFFIPPWSLILGYISFLPSFWRRHRLLVISTLAFIVLHILHRNQQERFMIPIIPALFLLITLAFWHRYREKGYILKNRKLFLSLAGISLIINFLLLIPFTTAYGHKGLIEPLIWIERLETKPRVMFVQPDMKRWIPYNYAGLKPPKKVYIRDWPAFTNLPLRERIADAFDLFILYPQKRRRSGNLSGFTSKPLWSIGTGAQIWTVALRWIDGGAKPETLSEIRGSRLSTEGAALILFCYFGLR